jgi:plastocyanin
MRKSSLFAVAAALASLSCGGDDGGTGPTNGGAITVSVVNNAFNPSTLSVPVNAPVTWQWNSGGVAHNVTFQDGTNSGNRTTGSYQRTFDAAGSFPYLCTLHGASMSGTVTVTASSSGGGGGGSGGGGGGYP